MTSRTLGTTLTLLACAMTLGCQTVPGTVATPDNLRGAPESANLAGLEIGIEGDAWRNNMPSPHEKDPGLFLTVRVRTVDNSPMPANVGVDTAWVVNGAQTWVAPMKEISRDPLGTSFETHAEGGPRWNPETAIDIVVSIHDGMGRHALIGLRDRTVQTAS